MSEQQDEERAFPRAKAGITPAELRDKIAQVMPEVLGPTHRRILAAAALRVVREAMREPPATIKTATGFGLATIWAQEVYLQMLAASPLREE